MKEEWCSKYPMPDFFIIGAPKCGTTSLARYLGEHPQILISSPKEPHYFSTDLKTKTAIRALNQYARCFKSGNRQYRAVGDASTSYLYSEVALANILKMNSAAKFIVLLRNPIDLVWSLHAELVSGLAEDETDFLGAWKLQELRSRGHQIPFGCFTPWALQYKRMGMLGEHVERAIATVGREKLLVLFLEDLSRDTRATYKKALGFLSVDDDGRDFFSRLNESKSVENHFLVRVVSIARMVRRAIKLPNISENLAVRLGGLGVKTMDKPVMSKEVFELLRGTFQADIEKLAKVINRDLTHWLSDKQEDGS